MIKLTDHFDVEEFSCMMKGKPCPFCGGAVIVDEILMLLALQLEELRSKLSKNYDKEVFIYIISGHRCFEMNKLISTCIPFFWSKHTMLAADIKAKCKDENVYISPKVIHRFADKIFKPGGVGLYSGHVHVDLRKWTARW